MYVDHNRIPQSMTRPLDLEIVQNKKSKHPSLLIEKPLGRTILTCDQEEISCEVFGKRQRFVQPKSIISVQFDLHKKRTNEKNIFKKKNTVTFAVQM